MTVQVLGTPNGTKKTKHVSKNCDPEWDETLTFYIDPDKDRLIGNIEMHYIGRWLWEKAIWSISKTSKTYSNKVIFWTIAEFVLHDLNRTVNEEIGREIFDFFGFKKNIDNAIAITYKNGSKIEVNLRLEVK